MGAVIAANSDLPYGDIYTNNSNHFHSMQGAAANVMQGSLAAGRSSSCMQAIDIHMEYMYDAYEIGNTSNVEAQELADVLRGILDEQQAQSSNYTISNNQYIQCVSPHRHINSYLDDDAHNQCVSPHNRHNSYIDNDAHHHCVSPHRHNSYIDDDAHNQCVSPHQANNSSNYLIPDGAAHRAFSPLVELHDDSELLCIAKHDLVAPNALLNAENLIALENPFNLDTPDQSTSSLSAQLSGEEIHNEQDNLISCMSSNCGAALMTGLGLLNYDNHNLDDSNPRSMSSAACNMETCSKPLVLMNHNLEEFPLCNGGAEASYGLLSSNHGACADGHGALKIEGDICSDHHVVCDDGYGMTFDHGLNKGSMDGDNVSKEHTVCPQGYQMVCDDGLYPTAMTMMQREAIYAAAALQPVDWAGILAGSAGTRPKRRNVRISHDPQTVSARRRRERISDRIRVLQRLVPGGTKMDTASMLDEAIHYLKFLKSQVQALEWLERRSSPPLSMSSSSSSPCFYPNLTTTVSLSNSRLIK